jgi:UDP-glucose 4-epimerase
VNVLVTGAGGNLGRVVVPALREAGHSPRVFDTRTLDITEDSVIGDIRNLDDVNGAVAAVDAVIHAAALHGIHLGTWSPTDFWAINVTGTFNVYEAARRAGVTNIVLCSSMSIYGKSAEPPEDAWGMVTESSSVVPADLYGFTKHACEELAQYYYRVHGIATVALRFGMFVPETFERYGFRLLFGGVDDRDVAQAVMLALEYVPPAGFDAFDIVADVPFSQADARELQQDPVAVLDRYWPGTRQLMEERELSPDDLIWGRLMWPPDKAKRVLGYRPQFTFTEFLVALQNDDRSYYPFAELPHWGL